MKHALLILIVMTSQAFADGPSKEVCLESHSKGQDARDQGKLSLARKLFLTCAQSTCPTLVQGDCARFADDLGRTQPTIGFVARDGNGIDLPDTTVYVDDMLVTMRLDDGKLTEVDPGKHTVKFVNAGKEQIVTVVVGAGEKGRTINATFGSPAAPAVPAPVAATPVKPAEPVEKTIRPQGAKILMIAGAAVAVSGIAVGVYGITRVPDACKIGAHECSAPPGDPVFADAKSAMRLVNVGFIAGGIGVAAAVGGLVWYYKGSTTTKEQPDRVVTPWMNGGGGGVAISGHF
jgi:hypothetical protein